MTNGPALRRHRRDSGVTVVALARVLGLSRQTVHTIEGRHQVDAELAARYVAAVRELARGEA
jgi:DNA-binding XRE family transcriptional regulator